MSILEILFKLLGLFLASAVAIALALSYVVLVGTVLDLDKKICEILDKLGIKEPEDK